MKKTWIAIVVGLSLGAVAGVASATLGKQEAAAMPCCSACDINYDTCWNSCNGDPACQDACDAKWLPCYNRCLMGC